MRVPEIKDTRIRCNHNQAVMLRKLKKKIEQDICTQLDILYPATALALYRHHGWRQDRICKMVMISHDVFCDCAEREDMSMVEFCAKELNVHLIPEGSDKGWEEYIFLNSAIDEGKPMNAWQYIAMLQAYIKWIPCQIQACILVAMHRKEGWGAGRCGELFCEIEDIKHEYRLNTRQLTETAKAETGFELGVDIMNVKKR